MQGHTLCRWGWGCCSRARNVCVCVCVCVYVYVCARTQGWEVQLANYCSTHCMHYTHTCTRIIHQGTPATYSPTYFVQCTYLLAEIPPFGIRQVTICQVLDKWPPARACVRVCVCALALSAPAYRVPLPRSTGRAIGSNTGLAHRLPTVPLMLLH